MCGRGLTIGKYNERRPRADLKPLVLQLMNPSTLRALLMVKFLCCLKEREEE